MNFTPLNSFSQRLAAVMLPLFSDPSTSSRDLHDNSWLLWQLAWLYRDAQVVSDPLLDKLSVFVNSHQQGAEPAEQIRRAWMKEIGCPQPGESQQVLRCHPAQKLRLILSRLFPNTEAPEQHLINYLICIAGMPETMAQRVLQWLMPSGTSVTAPVGAQLRVVESYAWLSPDAVLSVIQSEVESAQLSQHNEFHMIALPSHVSRPASLMLADGSLWLCWPKADAAHAPHPIIQATLVLHEASHLLKNTILFKAGPLATEADTLWSSEESALQAEWSALQKLCSDQPDALKNQFTRRWYEENYTAQLRMLFADWQNFLNDDRHHHCFSADSFISLPFLSAVYATLATKIYE